MTDDQKKLMNLLVKHWVRFNSLMTQSADPPSECDAFCLVVKELIGELNDPEVQPCGYKFPCGCDPWW